MHNPINKLALERMKQGLTLQQVADELLVNKVTIHHWESHKSKPRFDLFIEWVQFLKLDIKEVIK